MWWNRCGSRGDEPAAEDGYLWEERVRIHAVEGTVVAARVKMQKPPFLAARSVGLDGEGVFTALHTLFQVFNLPLLLLHEQGFYALEAFRDLLIE